MSESNQPLGKADLGKASAVFELLQALEPDLNLPLAMTLLAVARDPGLSVNDLADRIGAPQQTASRYAAILQGRYEQPGYESFVRTPLLSLEVSAHDPRRRALFLTQHGRRRLSRILHFGKELTG